MATDIFSRQVQLGGVFSADGATISFGPFTTGMLAQSVQWQYQQNITRLYEVASYYVYLVAGRTQGQANIQRVMGPTALQASFYQTFGDVCNASGNNISFAARTRCKAGDSGAQVTVGMYNCVIQQYGGSVQAQDMVVNEQIALMFLYLTYSQG